MVSPEVYFGIGLSGEQQHMVGITGAKLMVAVNNDPKASVFQQVDAPGYLWRIRGLRAGTHCQNQSAS